MKVAVIGAGIVGLSAARFLAKRGHRVSLYERFPLFHNRGSSHGRTRIVRRAYPDAFYTACMTEAYPLWAELEAESGQTLVDECGLLYFGRRDADRVVSMVKALTDIGVPHQILSPAETKERIPQARLDSDEVAVFTPEAGWVDAERALKITYDLAMAHGVEIYAPHAAEPDELGKSHDAVVLAPGAWIRDYVELDVQVTLQTFGYLSAQVPGPVWIDDRSMTYGFPSDEWGQKVGAHLPGPAVDPTTHQRAPWPDHVRQIEEAALRRFGVDAPLERLTTCLYTTTPTEDFRVGRLGHNIVFASACSGHGFKLGPWVGRLLADIVEGKDSIENHPRFHWPR